ncbi:MAG: hypothetical protein JXR95_13160 [Deltaproteobacteria bacterium]|nr:hypothetical protein [Deltaproteobacteria bacterium]
MTKKNKNSDKQNMKMAKPDKDWAFKSKSIMVSGRIAALIIFGSIAIWFIAVHLDLVFQTILLKHIQNINPFVAKYILFPVILEIGFIFGTLIILYMMGRFVDLTIWTTILGTIFSVHLIDMAVKFILDQFYFYYWNPKMLLMRIPGILITAFLGKFILGFALKREK